MNHITRTALCATLFIGICSTGFGQNTAYVVSTVAGQNRTIGDGGPASSGLFYKPTAIAADGSGGYYVADSLDFRIRKIDATGKITTVAGNGAFGFTGDGGPAASGSIGFVYGLAVDGRGNLYFSDFVFGVVRMVTPGGRISTVAGSGHAGYSGDGGPATAAAMLGPMGIAVDATSNLYIADSLNNRVRVVSPAGVINTYAGNGTYSVTRPSGTAAGLPLGDPEGLALDATGNLYVTSYDYSVIMKVTPTGTMSLFAGNGYSGFSTGDGGLAPSAYFNGPSGLAFDANGNCYVAERDSHILRKINAGGSVSTAAGTNAKLGFSGDGGPAGMGQFFAPYGVAIDPAGNVLVTDRSNNRIRKVNTTANTIAAFAGGQTPLGDGGPATTAQFLNPTATAVDSSGNIYVADLLDQRVRKIAANGTTTTVAGNGSPGYTGDSGPATSAQVLSPGGVAVDPFGSIFIADSGNNVIRRIAGNGNISTYAGTGVFNFGGDNGPASKAALANPNCVRSDAAGNIFFADVAAGRIRKINATSGVITSVAGSNSTQIGDNGAATAAGLSAPNCVFIDAANSLFIADSGNNRIRKVDTNGIITTVAGTGKSGFSGDGGAATSAMLNQPNDMVADSAGNLYISDTGNARIRKVTPNGIITTVAGDGGFGVTGDGSVATSAEIGEVQGLAIDASGAIYFSDSYNNRVRKLTLQTVAEPDFTLTSDAAGKTVAAGSSTTFTLTLASLNGFAGNVNFSATGMTSGTVTFSPASPMFVAAGKAVVVTATISIPAGTATGTQTIGFTTTSAALVHSVSATLSITATAPAGPVISAAGIANGASFLGGAVAPGEVVTLYGSAMGPASLATLQLDSDGNVMKSLGRTAVTFNGSPAALIYTSEGQVSAIVPYGVAGSATAAVQVSYNGVASNTVSIPVTDASPALFTYNSSGTGAAALLNQDNSVNTPDNPAARGSIITLYGTGEGQTTPGGVDGQVANAIYPKPVLPVTVTIDGQPAVVAYAGAAPGDVAGVIQINVTVGADVTPGPAVPIVFKVGTKTSPAGVTIAVQ
jgi:trimeric autotransporter adhesin